MRNHRQLNVLIIIVILLVGSVQLVLADAAPPQRPPAGSIETGGFETNVEMVSEAVLMEVGVSLDPESGDYVEDNSFMAHVEATFWMQNQGDETESFDVWFPTGVEDGYFDISVVENFAAWVNDVPAVLGQEETEGQWGDPVPWATWPVTFPPGETVVLTVAYDLRPTGFRPEGEFIYILETGAGWWGSIGEGIVTIRLPHEANALNVPKVHVSENMDSFQIDGTDLIWQFSDLEPTADDNINITVLSPSYWESVLVAEAAVAENPDSVEAYLDLAQIQNRALRFKGILNCCEALADATVETLQQALALDPENPDVLDLYLDLVNSLWTSNILMCTVEDIPTTIDETLRLIPENERFLDMIPVTLGSMQGNIERHPDDSTALQAAYEDILAVLQNAAAANPGNARLQELVDVWVTEE